MWVQQKPYSLYVSAFAVISNCTHRHLGIVSLIRPNGLSVSLPRISLFSYAYVLLSPNGAIRNAYNEGENCLYFYQWNVRIRSCSGWTSRKIFEALCWTRRKLILPTIIVGGTIYLYDFRKMMIANKWSYLFSKKYHYCIFYHLFVVVIAVLKQCYGLSSYRPRS